MFYSFIYFSLVGRSEHGRGVLGRMVEVLITGGREGGRGGGWRVRLAQTYLNGKGKLSGNVSIENIIMSF